MNDTAEQTESKSIIPDKYKGKYKGAEDWLSEFITEQAFDQAADKEGKAVGKPILNLEKLFNLAEANNINCSAYRKQADRPNAPGRLRMTIGNMLRSRAKKRLALYDTNKKIHKAPAEFLGDITEAIETMDGVKIGAVKKEAAE